MVKCHYCGGESICVEREQKTPFDPKVKELKIVTIQVCPLCDEIGPAISQNEIVMHRATHFVIKSLKGNRGS